MSREQEIGRITSSQWYKLIEETNSLIEFHGKTLTNDQVTEFLLGQFEQLRIDARWLTVEQVHLLAVKHHAIEAWLKNDDELGPKLAEARTVMPKTVALLDVDHTLLFDDPNQPNPHIIKALKAAGITDVYLFTDMTFRKTDVEDRANLKKMLEDNGLTVHGVIASPDIAWHIPDAELLSFEEAMNKNDIILNRNRPKNLDKLPAIIAQHPHINALVRGDLTRLPSPGNAFASVNNQYVEGTFDRSNKCKLILDVLSAELAHPKGLLFQNYVAHKPAWVQSFVVFDDNKHSLESVQQVAAKSNNSKHSTLVTTIRVENKDQANFDEQLAHHQSIVSWAKEHQGNPEPLKTLYEHAEELQPYWDAIIVALENINNDPLTCTNKLYNLQKKVWEIVMRRPQGLVGADAYADWAAAFCEVFPKLDDSDAKAKIISIQAGIIDHMKEIEEQSIIEDVGAFSLFLGILTIQGFNSSEPLNIQPDDKSAKMFVRNQEFMGDKKNNLAILSRRVPPQEHLQKWVDKLLDRYQKLAGLPIDNIVDFVIKNPQFAKHFLERRSLGNRNFRKEICRHPDLLHKLLESTDQSILAAITQTKLLASSHLNNDCRDAFTAKLESASSVLNKTSANVNPQPDGHFTSKQEEVHSVKNELATLFQKAIPHALKTMSVSGIKSQVQKVINAIRKDEPHAAKMTVSPVPASQISNSDLSDPNPRLKTK
jgi:hypothetical protein